MSSVIWNELLSIAAYTHQDVERFVACLRPHGHNPQHAQQRDGLPGLLLQGTCRTPSSNPSAVCHSATLTSQLQNAGAHTGSQKGRAQQAGRTHETDKARHGRAGTDATSPSTGDGSHQGEGPCLGTWALCWPGCQTWHGRVDPLTHVVLVCLCKWVSPDWQMDRYTCNGMHRQTDRESNRSWGLEGRAGYSEREAEQETTLCCAFSVIPLRP